MLSKKSVPFIYGSSFHRKGCTCSFEDQNYQLLFEF